ncbi:hypothetical protein [Scytonema sp. PRP1]|uniref:hypothetical protein n=1 Tax=Scytonema sp. PRP1 TaxID=3120513 RepID=UPI002FD16B22
MAQAGFSPNPPYTKVTLGYPPRPTLGKYTVTEEQVENWALAGEYDKLLPFYPRLDSPDWKNKQLKFVVPPYPYIPLSSS